MTKNNDIQLELSECLKMAGFAFWRLNLSTGHIESNLLYDQIFGYQSLIPDRCYDLFLSHIHPHDREKINHEFHSVRIKSASWQFECRISPKNASELRWIQGFCQTTKSHIETIIFGIIQDITKRKTAENSNKTMLATLQQQLENKIRYLAEHDSLTGLINRQLFEKRLTQAINLAKQQNYLIAVLFLDLDNFKQINDTQGHTIGDLVLRSVAEYTKKCIRHNDTLARVGGDEFALILTRIKNKKDLIYIVKKIIHCAKTGVDIANKNLLLSCSIGIAIYPEDGTELLIEKADTAMYYVKAHGKNNFAFFNHSMNIKSLS